MYKKIFASFIMILIFFSVACNSFVYAERYDTGDKVIYTDKYGRTTQIIDKSSFSQAGETALQIENVFSIIFLICLIVGIILFRYMEKNKKYNKIIEYIFDIVCVIGFISIIIYVFIYLASGGWSAH